MGSSTVRAQELANEANVQMTQETNQTNREIAEAQNELNYRMFNEQNIWNREQWQLENEYNSPSAQVQRYLEAGINPLWAIGNGDPGNAQHLESAEAHPAVGAVMQAPHVEAEYDPTRLNNIVAASRDLANTALGWRKLDLESMDVDTRRAAQMSGSALDYASAMNKRAATTQMEVQTAWDLDTFSTRAIQETEKLQNLRKQRDFMDSQSEYYKAASANYKASEDLTREKINRIAEDYQLRWKELQVAYMNAHANEESAGAQSSLAHTNSERLDFDIKFAKAQVAKWNNEQLLEFLRTFSPELSAEVKGGAQIGEIGISGKVGARGKDAVNLSKFYAAGLRSIEWYSEEPYNPKAAEAAAAAVDGLNSLENNLHVPFRSGTEFNTSNTSLFNPNWTPWQ